MLVKIDAEKVMEESIEQIRKGCERYARIMGKAIETDISKDKDCQKAFNAFYRVRRNEEWRNAFYQYFEEVKNKEVTFGEVIQEIYQRTGNVEG